MAIEFDHYKFLGLPTGEEGSKLTLEQITKAYKRKALELHPDKRRNDPNAQSNFQRLKLSYDILKDETSRKVFDEELACVKRKLERDSQCGYKRRRDIADLERREKVRVRDEKEIREEKIVKALKEEVEEISSMQFKKNIRNVGRLGKTAPSRILSSMPADFVIRAASRPDEEAILEKMRKVAEKQFQKSSKE